MTASRLVGARIVNMVLHGIQACTMLFPQFFNNNPGSAIG